MGARHVNAVTSTSGTMSDAFLSNKPRVGTNGQEASQHAELDISARLDVPIVTGAHGNNAQQGADSHSERIDSHPTLGAKGDINTDGVGRWSRARAMEHRLTLTITGLVALLLMTLAFGHTSHPAHAPLPGGQSGHSLAGVSSPAQTGTSAQAGQGSTLVSPNSQTTPVVPTSTSTPPAAANASSAPTPTSAAPRAAGDGFSLDPKDWVIAALGAAFNWIFSSLSSAFTDLLKQALDLDFLVLTPPGDTYQNAVVLSFWKALVIVADAALALLGAWAGYNCIVRDAIGARYHDAMQMLPRIALGALAVNLSLLFSQTLIDANNALCGVVSAPFAKVLALLQLNASSGVALFILLLAFGIVTLFLVAQMVVRLAMLNLLIVTAPLGLVCWVLPQTQPWARLWTRTFVSTVFVQFLQVLTLALGGALIAFFPNDGLFGAFMDLLIGLAICYAALKIPGMLRGLGGSSAPNPLSDAAGIAGTALMVSRLAALAAV